MAWCGSQSFEHVQNHTSFHEFYRGLSSCHDLFYDLNIELTKSMKHKSNLRAPKSNTEESCYPRPL